MHGDRLHFTYVDDFRPARFVKSPTEGADNWSNASGTATTNYNKGVAGYTGDWASSTKNQQAVMLNNVTASITSGKWAAGIDKVGTAGWKTKTQDKSGNYTSGYQTGKTSYLQAAQVLYPYIGQGQQQVAAMPKGTLQDSKNRALFWIDYMAAYSG